MAQSPLNSRRRDEPTEFNLREWTLKARMISRENTKSRRFSSSYITSFREYSRSFRSTINISSTASSPGYNLRALQARSVNTWDCLSPEGFALNSKWNEAEKYICNPLSGEVPMECLSAKTLGGRSFRNLTGRITMSATLIYPSHSRFIQTEPSFSTSHDDEAHFHNIVKEKKVANVLTRDMGVQSKLPDFTWTTSTPASTPRLRENSPQSNASGNPPISTPKLKSEEEEEEEKGEMKETDYGKEETEREEEEEVRKTEAGQKQVHHNNMWKCRGGKIGCLSLRSLWTTRKSDKHRSRNKMKKNKKKNIFPLPCYNNNNNNNNNGGC